jgi:serine/threonine-protein kinase RsbW
MESLERTFTLHVPSSTQNLSMIRDFVSSIGQQAGLTETEVIRVALAVDEACANVIEHAYGSDSTRQVTIRASFDETMLEFLIVDNGLGFDPASVQSQDVEELIRQRKSGGLGLRLIRTIMDDVQYSIIPGEKNELRMVKKLHK